MKQREALLKIAQDIQGELQSLGEVLGAATLFERWNGTLKSSRAVIYNGKSITFEILYLPAQFRMPTCRSGSSISTVLVGNVTCEEIERRSGTGHFSVGSSTHEAVEMEGFLTVGSRFSIAPGRCAIFTEDAIFAWKAMQDSCIVRITLKDEKGNVFFWADKDEAKAISEIQLNGAEAQKARDQLVALLARGQQPPGLQVWMAYFRSQF